MLKYIVHNCLSQRDHSLLALPWGGPYALERKIPLYTESLIWFNIQSSYSSMDWYVYLPFTSEEAKERVCDLPNSL